ncbi:hypothetical protein RO21_11270 [[Actinobacillus] muris]|uniref:Uncharacterized protein n=1 Tax=Muribacter muris TaxID=67855 RepID=A0A0J5P4X7_9PAST|nr:hypothetical protein [Muribacter muris]KMK50514.1 hypothetical protein RO21_11270 [[Actinobacillus] muris] [Muribacter muris]
MQFKQSETESLQDLLLKIDSRIGSIEAQFEELTQTLNRRNRPIWTEQQIADYLGLSYGYVTTKIVTLEDFPKPIDYGSTGIHRRHRRYFSAEIIAYFKQQERRKQTKRIIQRRTQQDIGELVVQARKNAIKSLRGFTGI